MMYTKLLKGSGSYCKNHGYAVFGGQGDKTTGKCMDCKFGDGFTRNTCSLVAISQDRETTCDQIADSNCHSLCKGFSDGAHVLSIAAFRGDLSLVEFLIDQGIDVNTCSPAICSPLSAAAYERHLHVVKCLVERNANPNIGWTDAGPLLIQAVRSKDLETTRLLLQSEIINPNVVHEPGHFNYTALSVACKLGDYEISCLLLRHKNIDPNLKTEEVAGGLRTSPLMKVLNNSAAPEIVDLFLEREDVVIRPFPEAKTLLENIDLDGKSRTSQLLLNKVATKGTVIYEVLLWLAARKGDAYTVRCILANYRIDPNIDFERATPLALAAKHGHSKVVQYLLQSKHINLGGTFHHFSPLEIAIDYEHEEVVRLMLNYPNIEAHMNFEQSSALIYAIERNKVRMVSFLLNELHLDVNEPRECTPLSYACLIGNKQIVDLLLSYKNVDLEARCTEEQYSTPLMCAASRGHYEIVQELLTKGLHGLRGGHGETCLSLAARYNYPNVMQLLNESGVKKLLTRQEIKYADESMSKIEGEELRRFRDFHHSLGICRRPFNRNSLSSDFEFSSPDLF